MRTEMEARLKRLHEYGEKEKPVGFTKSKDFSGKYQGIIGQNVEVFGKTGRRKLLPEISQ